MTRKRFIKLMISKGYDRNSAHGIAHLARSNGFSYDDAYRKYTKIPNMLDAVSNAVSRMTDIFQQIGYALHKGFEAFGQAYHSAMQTAKNNGQPQ